MKSAGINVLLRRCFLLSLIISGCSFKDTDNAEKTARTWEKSPFSGTWMSSDSDQETAFKLYIVQEEDSLKGYYCMVKQDDGQSACQSPDAARNGFAFSAKAPQTSGFSTELYNLQHQTMGHVQLTLSDSVLFWQLLRGPDNHEFMIRQTTFRIDAPLE